MFYPESEELLAKYHSRESDVRTLDELLHECGGETIILRNVAFLLEIPEDSLQRFIDWYCQKSIATEIDRADCPSCESELMELISTEEDCESFYCDHCEQTATRETLTMVKCYQISPSPKPKLRKKEEKKLMIKDRILHGRTRPWSILAEEDYLRSLPTLGGADQTWILDRLQQQGFCLLRWQGLTPSHERLLAIEEFLGPACETQNGVSGKIKEINPKEAVDANTGDSAKELKFHTDGTQDDHLPPAFLVFQYLTTPTFGGTSTFLDMSQLLLDLPEDLQEEILVGLSYPDTAVCEKKGLRYEGALIKPVCADQAVSIRIRLDDKIQISSRSQHAFDLLKQKILEQTSYLKYSPLEGDIAIFDNHRVVHGRKSISGGRHLRFHDRMWIKELDERHKGKYLNGVRGLSSDLIAKIKRANAGP